MEIGTARHLADGRIQPLVRIPQNLRGTIERVHGELGREWLKKFPDLIAECQDRWSLRLSLPFDNLSYNVVLPATLQDGNEVVLKLGVPCPELTAEIAALNLFQGIGAVRLLDHDALRGVLLMERILPGTALHQLQSEPEATRTAATLMSKLWRFSPVDHAFPTLAVWFQAFERLRNNFGG